MLCLCGVASGTLSRFSVARRDGAGGSGSTSGSSSVDRLLSPKMSSIVSDPARRLTGIGMLFASWACVWTACMVKNVPYWRREIARAVRVCSHLGDEEARYAEENNRHKYSEDHGCSSRYRLIDHEYISDGMPYEHACTVQRVEGGFHRMAKN